MVEEGEEMVAEVVEEVGIEQEMVEVVEEEEVG